MIQRNSFTNKLFVNNEPFANKLLLAVGRSKSTIIVKYYSEKCTCAYYIHEDQHKIYWKTQTEYNGLCIHKSHDGETYVRNTSRRIEERSNIQNSLVKRGDNTSLLAQYSQPIKHKNYNYNHTRYKTKNI